MAQAAKRGIATRKSEANGRARMRAWWWHRQGLDGSLAGKSAAEVLERAGWARSVGGVGPYLTLFARAGIGREAADAAVARLEIHELPAARGCTYVVPASEFALALRAGKTFAGAELKTGLKLGVTEKEIEKLGTAVVEALADGPLDPEGLRQATGGAARSLGEAGKKKGLGTTLPIALGLLQAEGRIRRIPQNGRLDQQRYRYALWTPSPLGRGELSAEDAWAALARRFFRWVGPARVTEFQWFSGLGAKAVREVVEPLGLVPFEPGSDLCLLPEDADAARSFSVPAKPRYALVSSIDALTAARRNVEGLVEPADRDREVLVHDERGALGSFSDLPHHGIFDRGRLVGLWDYDPEAQAIVWTSFVGKDRALVAAVAQTEAYVRDQLGDARAFSLDSPASRGARLKVPRRLR